MRSLRNYPKCSGKSGCCSSGTEAACEPALPHIHTHPSACGEAAPPIPAPLCCRLHAHPDHLAGGTLPCWQAAAAGCCCFPVHVWALSMSSWGRHSHHTQTLMLELELITKQAHTQTTAATSWQTCVSVCACVSVSSMYIQGHLVAEVPVA